MIMIKYERSDIGVDIVEQFIETVREMGFDQHVIFLTDSYIDSKFVNVVKFSEYVEYEEDEILEMVSLALTNNAVIAVESDEMFDKINTIVEDYNIVPININKNVFDKEIDLTKLTKMEMGIVKEIFESTEQFKNFNSWEIRNIDIYENYVYDAELGDSLEVNITSMINTYIVMCPDHLEFNIHEVFNPKDTIFNTKFYDITPYLNDSIHDKLFLEKLLEFKMKVFNAIKNLKVEDYPSYDTELVTLLNMNSFVNVEDTKEILNLNEGDKNVQD